MDRSAKIYMKVTVQLTDPSNFEIVTIIITYTDTNIKMFYSAGVHGVNIYHTYIYKFLPPLFISVYSD